MFGAAKKHKQTLANIFEVGPEPIVIKWITNFTTNGRKSMGEWGLNPHNIPRAAMTSIFEGQPVNPSKQALLNDQNKGHLGWLMGPYLAIGFLEPTFFDPFWS